MLKEIVSDIREFYGQEIYSGIGASMSKNKPERKFAFGVVKIGMRFAFFNFSCLALIILVMRLFRYPENGRRIFQYGVTRNNVAAFNKLNECLSPALIDNISINFRGATWSDRLCAVLSVRQVWQAAKVLSKDCHPDPLVQVRACIGAAAYVLYTVRPVSDSVQVLCVASDHSPVARALVTLFKINKKKTCYVQHAPVTDYFPPLNTDLSVLYDEISVDAYRRSAARAGKPFDADTVLMPPFTAGFRQPFLDGGVLTVGLCLGRYPEYKRLAPIVEALAKVLEVQKLVIRPHPACQLNLSPLLASNKVSLQPEGQSLKSFAEGVDLALVPNSGVALELLHDGIPTFYMKGMDDLPDDYYGFVRGKILPQFDKSFLFSMELVNALFGDKWVKKYARYDVTVTRSIDECRKEVARKFENLLMA